MMRRAGLSTMHCYGGKIIQHCNSDLLFWEEWHSALIFLLIALLFLERGCFRCISTTLRWSPVVDCAGNVLLHCSQIPALPRTPLVCHSLNPNILVLPIFSSKFWIFLTFSVLFPSFHFPLFPFCATLNSDAASAKLSQATIFRFARNSLRNHHSIKFSLRNHYALDPWSIKNFLWAIVIFLKCLSQETSLKISLRANVDSKWD